MTDAATSDLPPVNDSPPGEQAPQGPQPDAGQPPARSGDEEAPPGFRLPTAEAALEFMRSQLGLEEDPPNSNCNWITQQFFKDAGRPSELAPGCYAWCAATVSLALNQAFGDIHLWQVPGVGATYEVGTAYVPALREFFRAADRYHAEPEVGDVAIFVWGPGAPIGDHTGLVESVPGDGTVVTIDGNPGSNVLSRQRRTIATTCDGFGRPPYEEDPFMALTADQLNELFSTTKATNDAVGRLEVAIRDPNNGLQAQFDALKAKVDQLLAK